MSRKKPVILGPDGKPYVAPPKPKPVAKTTLEVGGVDISADVKEYTFSTHSAGLFGVGGIYGSLFGSSGSPSTRAKKAAADPFRAAVAEQVGDLTSDFDGVGGAEMPKPARDLHTYADAFASARENCKHPDAEDTIHSSREFYCPDCRRYIGFAEYRRTRGFGGLFG